MLVINAPHTLQNPTSVLLSHPPTTTLPSNLIPHMPTTTTTTTTTTKTTTATTATTATTIITTTTTTTTTFFSSKDLLRSRNFYCKRLASKNYIHTVCKNNSY